jgi:hypothetical protein
VKILFLCRDLFRIEFECGKMENKIVIRSLRRQLDHVILHEQVENGATINSNLSINHMDW